mmetsp:Transcript_39525/g.35308  ORF Transcript_39525/g.35308 Transcript_39525/m.35308 type:complete len:262 (-) Transcript_39525:223-1008(-)
MAEFPARIRKCFITRETNKEGAYSVIFYRGGRPVELIIDDYFPCKATGRLMFSKPNGRELWAILMEKAYCKLAGSYTVAEAGTSDKAYEVLTGCPSDYINIDKIEEDDLFARVQKFDKKNYLLACGTRPSGGKEMGIVAGHAYTIISAHEYKGIKLFKIRNPWGRGEWKGDYGDKSPKWTPDLKAFVNFTDADDGVFFMTVKDFKIYYDSVCVGMYRDEYEYSFVPGRSNPKEYKFFKFFITSPTEIYLRAHQLDERFRRI